MTLLQTIRLRVEVLPTAVRYLIVGLVSYAVDIIGLLVAWTVLGLPLWLATTCGFWLSFSVNFLLSRYWTFDAAGHRSFGQVLRYSVLVAANYLVTVVAVTNLHRLGFDVLVARTLILAALTVSTYFVYRHWVFGSPESKTDRASGPEMH